MIQEFRLMKNGTGRYKIQRYNYGYCVYQDYEHHTFFSVFPIVPTFYFKLSAKFFLYRLKRRKKIRNLQSQWREVID